MSEPTQLGKRLIWSTLLVGMSLYAIFWAHPLIFLLVVEGFIVLGLLEYFNLAERKGFFINRTLGLSFGVLLAIQPHLPGEAIVLTLAMLSLAVFNFQRHLREQAIVSTALTSFGLLYVAWCLSFLVKIRALAGGAAWVFYCILVIKLGDAAAYFIGKRFGVHKYAASISPNKSMEGSVAGFIATCGASVMSKVYLPNTPLGHLVVLGLVLAILGPLGDLAESLLKRDAGVKDSGNIPGLGGILDILDSLLPSVPVVYYYLVMIERGGPL